MTGRENPFVNPHQCLLSERDKSIGGVLSIGLLVEFPCSFANPTTESINQSPSTVAEAGYKV